MIVVTAQMWPQGQQANSYEIMTTTVTNQGSDKDGENYFAHIINRPAPHIGVAGYEADVEIHGHVRAAGLAPLLISILATSYNPGAEFSTPGARVLERSVIENLDEFDKRLKGRR